MKIKPFSFKTKLIVSYIFIILFSFGLTAYLLSKNLRGASFFISFLFALGVAFIAGSLLTRSIIRPLNKIISVSRKFSEGDLSLRIDVDTKDEIAELALTLNKMAQDLQEKIREIRRLENVRRDFVANVSHEIKTPLTSIRGFAETLLEGAIDDKENSRQFLQIIRDHANRLDALVNDLLELSRIEFREMPLKKERIFLKALVDDILPGFNAHLKNKPVKIQNELSVDLCPDLDKNKMGQVFTNLIDNAIKFNRENGSTRIYNEDAGKAVKITVEDSGIGIPAKDLPRIFERFYRVDKARSRELGGTGLGLSIVKHLVEAHGGNVGVESIEGQGSKFWFTLPK